MLEIKGFEMLYIKNSHFKLNTIYTLMCIKCNYVFDALKTSIENKENDLKCPYCSDEI